MHVFLPRYQVSFTGKFKEMNEHKIERTGCLQEVVTGSAVTDPILPIVKEPLPGCPDLCLRGHVHTPGQVTAWRRETKDADQLCALVTLLWVLIWAGFVTSATVRNPAPHSM